MNDLLKRLRAVGDPIRLRTLHLLAHCGECCVCEIQEILDLTAPTASRNLKILEEAGWVSKRRDGRWMYYRLADDPRGRWQGLRVQLLADIGECEEASADLVRYELREDESRICTIDTLRSRSKSSETSQKSTDVEALERSPRMQTS